WPRLSHRTRSGWSAYPRAPVRFAQMFEVSPPSPGGSTGSACGQRNGVASTGHPAPLEQETVLEALHLQEVELHRRFTPEHVDEHPDLALLRVDLVHSPDKVFER